MRRLPLLFVSLALAACTGSSTSSPDILTGAAAIEITSARTSIVVKNRGATLVRFFLVDAGVQPLMLFAPCDTTCLGVAAGQTLTVPMTTIIGFSAGTTDISMMWWQFAPGPNDRIDSSIQSKQVRLD